MRLTDLTDLIEEKGGADIEISGLTSDSRNVRPGWLFAALKGVRHDGRDYIGEAIANGAVAILTDLENAGEVDKEFGEQAIILQAANPRRELALMAARFYRIQPETIAAVTGTNGKSSTIHFTWQLWEALGFKCASLGTLGVRGSNITKSGGLTTPDPVKLHAEIADLASAGITHLAVEASSHGLHQHRLDGLRVTVAGFTNFSHDHLDYHKTMDDYLEAKSRLFSGILKDGGAAVINADIPEFGRLVTDIEERDVRILTYGYNGDDIRLVSVTPGSGGQSVTLEAAGEEISLTIPLVGAFQVMNMLCALGLVLGSVDDAKKRLPELAKAMETIKGAPGRLEHAGSKNGAAIYVDFAHSPDALEHVLKALRPHAKGGRLVCLFGCGGDRDARKRPLMGKVAETYADRIIVTDDNPRHEDPEQIRENILEGIQDKKQVKMIGGRGKAIKKAIKSLKKGDLLLVAGKGHETGQVVGGKTIPFSDIEEIRKILKS